MFDMKNKDDVERLALFVMGLDERAAKGDEFARAYLGRFENKCTADVSTKIHVLVRQQLEQLVNDGAIHRIH